MSPKGKKSRYVYEVVNALQELDNSQRSTYQLTLGPLNSSY